MDCYACDREATQRCSRCGNGYCAGHGDGAAAGGQALSTGPGRALCAECLDPVNATPSSATFRVSLFALLGVSVLALWLLVRPPPLPGESSGSIRPLPTTSPIFTTQPTASPAASPGVSATPAASAGATPEPTPEPTAAGPIEYVMQEGDTVSGVAEAYGISYLDLLAFNGLTEEEAQVLQPGDVILIPQ